MAGSACGVGTWSKFVSPVPPDHQAPISAWTGTHFVQFGGSVGAMPPKYDSAGFFLVPSTGGSLPFFSGLVDANPERGGLVVWTGSRILAGSGFRSFSSQPNDALVTIAPGDKTWTTVSHSPFLDNRQYASAVWTGKEMLVWGGWTAFSATSHGTLQSGGRYDDSKSAWASISLKDAPTARQLHTAAWTGSRMLVWGGHAGGLDAPATADPGGIYDATTDTWQPMSTLGAPSPRGYHTGVWTGSQWLIWGGAELGYAPALGDGAAYDPASNTWSPMSMTGAPSPRAGHIAVWTGKAMFVFGGALGGALYDPATNTWERVSECGPNPGSCSFAAAQFTGTQIVVSGGGCQAIFTPP